MLSLLTLSSCGLFFYSKQVILYRVRAGDNLANIGERFRVSYQDIADENSIYNSSKIFVGQILEIPYFGQKVRKTNTRTELGFSPEPKSKGKTGKSVDVASAKKYLRQLAWPVSRSKARLTSKFGWRWMKFHEGIDLGGPRGTPIYASHSGRVVYSGNRISGYGNLIVLKANNILTVYAHNDRNRVRSGAYVTKGQRIADLGASGNVTGPHLHYEVRVKNKAGKYAAVDPMLFLR